MVDIVLSGTPLVLQLGENTAETVRQAGIATDRATAAAGYAAATSATLVSAPKQGGMGTVVGDGNGPQYFDIARNMSRGAVWLTADSTGAAVMLAWFNTRTNQLGMKSAAVEEDFTVKGAVTLQGKANAAQIEIADSRAMVQHGSPQMISPAENTRNAWGIAGFLTVDTKDNVLRPDSSGVPRVSETVPAGALALLGGRVVMAKPGYRTQAGLGSIAPVIRQGSALAAYASVNAGGLRTHQEVPSVTRVGNWLYAVWYALNGTLGSATNEALGNYLVVARRALTGSTWTEIAQIIPSDMATARYYDPVITEDDGRIVILWATTCKLRSDSYSLGTAIYHYATGCWGVILENPEAPAGGRFDFGKPRFLEYGVPSTPFKANGSLHLPIDVWRNGTYIGASFELPYRYPDVGGAGSRLCRLVTAGYGAPYVERLSVMPGTTSGDESYSETQAVMVDGGSWLAFRRTAAGIKSLTASADLGGTTADWTGPTDATTLTSMTTASRCALIRTAMGNLAFVGNTSGRTDMYLRLSADEGTTMGYSKQLVTGSTYEVSYPSAVSWIDSATSRAKIGMVWDRGRGGGSSYPADIVWCEVFEDEIIAGTATVTVNNISTL